MKDCGTHYEYLAVCLDDVIVASKDPKVVYEIIPKVYTMKGVGVLEYFLGAAYRVVVRVRSCLTHETCSLVILNYSMAGIGNKRMETLKKSYHQINQPRK